MHMFVYVVVCCAEQYFEMVWPQEATIHQCVCVCVCARTLHVLLTVVLIFVDTPGFFSTEGVVWAKPKKCVLCVDINSIKYNQIINLPCIINIGEF